MAIRGITSRQEQKAAALTRDVRTVGQKFRDFMRDPFRIGLLILFMTVSLVFTYPISDVIFVLIVPLFVYGCTQRLSLPFRLPQRANLLDPNYKIPGTRTMRKSAGIYFFGNDKETKEELWFTNEDMRTHALIFGSTGSGKTETLVSLAYNALVQSSGFIYVDGKGDNGLYAKIFSMVRYMGREDDLLLINFMTGGADIIGPQPKRLSNTLNPFSSGSSSMLANLVTGMMDGSSGSGDGDMWKGRAIAFIESLLKVLVAMRDAGHILLDANCIRNYFGLERLEAMVADKTFIRDNAYAISMDSLPDKVSEPIRNYLYTLPGYNKERKGKQVSQVFEQHGYITMQLTRVFTSLADTYGHICRSKLAEVDLKDVVLNRRILLVLLPALEKSPDELSNLGKVVIASMRSMMAAGLGDAVEGTFADLVERKPTNAKTPYLCILDEYGYYAVKGFAVVPAQARSLGFSVIFAGQDLPAFQKASKEEAASIGANTNIKICMKLEDPTETWDFFMKSAGESYVTSVESFQIGGSSVSNTYRDTKTAKAEKRARIDMLDLKEQVEGDAHILFTSKIVRARMFYANPKPVKALRLNVMIMVDYPTDDYLYNMVKAIEDIEAMATKQSFDVEIEDDELGMWVSGAVDTIGDSHQMIENIAKALSEKLAPVVETESEQEQSSVAEPVDKESLSSSFDAFARLSFDRLSSGVAGPLLDKVQLKESIEQICVYLGDSSQKARENAESVADDVSSSSRYDEPKGLSDSKTIVKQIDEIITSISE
ncbi:MAG: phosphoesterase [Legionellales bacterium]|nr:phosphoesterase [Legionellales bacterium]